jgi:glycosyltransferase involved in cell wall biosynthesis
MSAPRYSVIVPAYQAEGTIGACVRALNAQTLPRDRYEIIVVDDDSTDRTANVAREAGADRVLTVPHGGPAAARNAGVDAARGEIVLFTDADCEPSPEWLERMVAPLADPGVTGAKGTYRTRQRALMARLVQLEYEFRYERMAPRAADRFRGHLRRRLPPRGAPPGWRV